MALDKLLMAAAAMAATTKPVRPEGKLWMIK